MVRTPLPLWDALDYFFGFFFGFFFMVDSVRKGSPIRKKKKKKRTSGVSTPFFT